MIEIKPYNPESGDDFLPLMTSNNHTWPDFMKTLREVEMDWKMHRKDKFRQAFLMEEDGQPCALAVGRDAYWASDPHPLFVDLTLFPGAQIGSCHPLADHLEALAVERGAPKLQIEICDIYAEMIDFWKTRNFESKLDGFVSRLDVHAFDSSGVQSGLDRFEAAGMTIQPLTNLPCDDEDFQRRLYDLRWEVNQDIPSADAPVREPFERFKEIWLSGTLVPFDCFFIAFDDGEMVGLTNGRPFEAMPDKFDTFTTGVARTHRRRGVATALKVHIIEWCRANGFRWIETGNEQNNPMYDLNLALGFRQWCSFCVMEKPLPS